MWLCCHHCTAVITDCTVQAVTPQPMCARHLKEYVPHADLRVSPLVIHRRFFLPLHNVNAFPTTVEHYWPATTYTSYIRSLHECPQTNKWFTHVYVPLEGILPLKKTAYEIGLQLYIIVIDTRWDIQYILLSILHLCDLEPHGLISYAEMMDLDLLWKSYGPAIYTVHYIRRATQKVLCGGRGFLFLLEWVELVQHVCGFVGLGRLACLCRSWKLSPAPHAYQMKSNILSSIKKTKRSKKTRREGERCEVVWELNVTGWSRVQTLCTQRCESLPGISLLSLCKQLLRI